MALAPNEMLPPDFAEFAGRAGYQVETDGRVYTSTGGKKSYVPPWVVWQNSTSGKDPVTGQLTPDGMAHRIPGSDPNSVWHFMYENGGPFRKGSQWDTEKGTYKGSIDWGTLLGTIAAGGLIGAGIAGAATGGSVAAGGGSTGGSAAGGLASTSAGVPALGTLPTVTASGMVPAALGVGEGIGLAGVGAGVTEAGLAGTEGAATTGLTAGVLPGEVGSTMGIGDAVAGGLLPSSTITPTMGSLAPTVAPSGAVPAGVSTGSGLMSGSTMSKISDIAGLAGKGIGSATQAAGETQLTNAKLGLDANGQNIQGQNAFENQLMARAKKEQEDRKNALANIYRSSMAANPRVSPYNIVGAPKYSQDYLDALNTTAAQGKDQINAPLQYGSNTLPPLVPYKPYKPDTDPSTMQTIGNWLSPTLSTIGAIAKLYGK